MSSFPKKYKTQDLRNRAKIYRDKQTNQNINDDKSSHFFINTLPISQKISYNEFFPIYMSDFFSYRKAIEDRQIYNSKTNVSQQLFVIY